MFYILFRYIFKKIFYKHLYENSCTHLGWIPYGPKGYMRTYFSYFFINIILFYSLFVRTGIWQSWRWMTIQYLYRNIQSIAYENCRVYALSKWLETIYIWHYMGATIDIYCDELKLMQIGILRFMFAYFILRRDDCVKCFHFIHHRLLYWSIVKYDFV